MNKIKLLYDVVNTLKNKEKINGILEVNVQRNQETVFSLRNEFEKNVAGQGKAKIASELNLDGKKVKHESNTEFTMPGHCQHHLGLMHKLHQRHHGMAGCCGLKAKLARITCVLGILNSLKLEEKPSGAVVSLNLSELPEDLKMMLQEKMNQKHACHPHGGFLKECHSLEALDGVLILTANKNNEIESLVVNVDGTVQNAENEQHAIAASAEVQFTW